MINYKLLEEFPGYRVGDDGSVWTCWRSMGRGRGHGQSNIWVQMKPRKQFGYVRIGLRKEGKKHARFVHRLVLESFVGKCPDGLECCHNDTNSENNNLTNLRWDTRQSNRKDSYEKYSKCKTGSKHNRAKLTEEMVVQIKSELKSNAKTKELANQFNVSVSAINNIKYGYKWKHVEV